MSFGIYVSEKISNFEFSSFNEIIEKRRELFNLADEALYRSKNKGRNKITLFPNKNEDDIEQKKFRVI